MGRRGPPRAPTAQLEARGSWLAKTRQGEPEPSACDSAPPAPEHLPGSAAEVWQEVAPQLVGCGVLTAADLHTFERYCRTYAAWRVAMAAIEVESMDRTDVLVVEKLDAMLRRMERAFGMDPAARADLVVSDKGNSSKHGNSGNPLKPRLVG